MVERRSGTQAVICGKYIHIAEKGLGFMKKIITLLLTFIMCISLCACGNSKGDVSGSITTKQATIAIKDNSLDSVYDTYKKNKLNCITVFCDYTNNGESESSMFLSGSVTAFQNGVELKEPNGKITTYFPQGVKEKNTRVMTGYSYTTYYNFVLEDKTAPVVVKISLGNKSSEITYDLGQEATVNKNQSDEPGVVELENASIKVNKCKFGQYGVDKQYRQYTCAMIICDYTNKSDKEQSLASVIQMQAYQNGKELNSPEYYGSFNQIKHFKDDAIPAGESTTSGFCFVPENSNDPVTVKITDFHGAELTEIELVNE